MDIAGKQDKIYFFCSRLLAYYILMQYITLQTKYITIQKGAEYAEYAGPIQN